MIYLPTGLKVSLLHSQTDKTKSGIISYFRTDDSRSEMTIKDLDGNEEEYITHCISGSFIVLPKEPDLETTIKHAFQEGLASMPFSCKMLDFCDEPLIFLDFPTAEEKPDSQKIVDWFNTDENFSVLVMDLGPTLVTVSYSDLYRLTLL